MAFSKLNVEVWASRLQGPLLWPGMLRQRRKRVLVRRTGPHEPEGVADSVRAGRAGGGRRVQRPAQAVADAYRPRRAVRQDARHQERAQPAKSTSGSISHMVQIVRFSLHHTLLHLKEVQLTTE